MCRRVRRRAARPCTLVSPCASDLSAHLADARLGRRTWGSSRWKERRRRAGEDHRGDRRPEGGGGAGGSRPDAVLGFEKPRPAPRRRHPPSPASLAGATLTLPPRPTPESAARQTQRGHREDARAGRPTVWCVRGPVRSRIADPRARALPSVDLLELALRADPRSSSSRHLPPPRSPLAP